MINNWPPGYYVLRDRLPFVILILYQLSHDKKHKKYTDLFSQLIIGVVTGLTLFFLYGYLRGYHIEIMYLSLVGVPNITSYIGPIQWGAFATILNYRLLKTLKDPTLSATIAIYAILAGGYIYEIPLFLRKGITHLIRINSLYVFFISFQILSIPILIYIITKRTTLTISPAPIIGTFIYLMYTALAFPPYLLWSLLPNNTWKWLARLPTITALYLLLNSIQPKEA